MEQRPLCSCDSGESCGEGTNLCQEVKDCGDVWSRGTNCRVSTFHCVHLESQSGSLEPGHSPWLCLEIFVTLLYFSDWISSLMFRFFWFNDLTAL